MRRRLHRRSAMAATLLAASVAFIAPVALESPASADDPLAGYVSLVPARLLDTRPGEKTIDGTAAGLGLPAAGSTTVLQITGRGGVPLTSVGAAVLNITAVNQGGSSFVTVFPSCLLYTSDAADE